MDVDASGETSQGSQVIAPPCGLERLFVLTHSQPSYYHFFSPNNRWWFFLWVKRIVMQKYNMYTSVLCCVCVCCPQFLFFPGLFGVTMEQTLWVQPHLPQWSAVGGWSLWSSSAMGSSASVFGDFCFGLSFLRVLACLKGLPFGISSSFSVCFA